MVTSELDNAPLQTAMLRNEVYYLLKPVIPATLRRALRQRVASRIRERTEATWPILPGSERLPQGWSGWPQGRRFAVVITHDVEGQRGVDNCRRLMQLDMEMGFASSFNFIPEGSYDTPRDLRHELTGNGFEVGVHDLRHDGRLFRSRKTFSRKASQINSYLRDWNASGFRSGFMLHKLDWLHELDISYDMSTFDTDPFEPQPDGSHTIFPFWVNGGPVSRNGNGSHAGDKTLGYVELPYTLAQDSTLFLLLHETTPEIWLRKADWIAAHGGMVLVNIHPDYIDFERDRHNGSTYPARLVREFLSYLSRRYAGQFWNPRPAELARWYKEWHNSKLERESRRLESNGRSQRFRPLQGRRAAVVLFSHYPADPRPRRAAEALVSEGVSVDLICLQEEGSEPRREVVNGVNVKRIRLKRRRSGKLRYAWQYSAFLLIAMWELALRSLRKRYQFVHVHNMPDILVFSALVPKLLGARVVLDLHDPMPELMEAIFQLPPHSAGVRMLKAMEKWSIAFSDSVITVSSTFKNLFSSRSCSPEKIHVVLNSPDESIFKFQVPRVEVDRINHRSRPFVILYHGSLLKRNGFDLAVSALEQVLSAVPSARLVVCGKSTPFFESVMNSLPSRGLSEKVEYRGACQLEGIVEAIRNCDVGIIPNHRNIFTELNTPTRIFECLALGKPVIAPRARGITDYFGENELIYFELGNAKDLADQINYIHSHPDQVAQTVSRGQQIYFQHTWRVERAQLINTFLASHASL
ncbi:MAG: glycosyltransferase [Verrucomicrobia bacterium]|nr:glycosyltransferase [Verrucomicrobiota bacterium]